jgi:hypothetical protein
VVVENFRPGVMARLGLDYAALKARKKRHHLLRDLGFGQDGPLKFNPAYDQIIQGLCGVMSVTWRRAIGAAAGGYPSPTPWAAFPPPSPLPRRCSPRAKRGGRVHRRLHAGSFPGRHGLGGLELADRRREAAAHGQREHDREPVRHIPHRRRAF